jgi:hypothetical protein
MSEDSPPCGLGDRLADAQQGGFFSWFCLSAIGADEPAAEAAIDPAHNWQRFRPSGPRFHHLVELAVGLDESARISAASLGIARSFIEMPAIRPFARDIAKSFLNWMLPAETAAALRQEIELIGTFADGESVVITHADVPRPGWLHRVMGRSHEAAVFMGRVKRSKRRVGGTRIVFENRADPPHDMSSPAAAAGGGWLFIRVSGA